MIQLNFDFVLGSCSAVEALETNRENSIIKTGVGVGSLFKVGGEA